jgi:hypothetical protein
LVQQVSQEAIYALGISVTGIGGPLEPGAHGLLLFAWLGIMAFAFAKLEIHIEGPHGWARDLPTWRIEGKRWQKILFGGRPITGYHVWALSSMAILFHLGPVLTGAISWRMEARILGCLALFWVLEDFLWFVMNPAYGLKRFREDKISWHKHWVGSVPVEYIVFGILGLGMVIGSFMI